MGLLINKTMTGGSLGIRSGSYGSLDKQLQNGVLPIQASLATRTIKPSKMFKEKETLVHWICKFAGRKKVGMLFLCVISAAVFVWVLYVGKGWFFFYLIVYYLHHWIVHSELVILMQVGGQKLCFLCVVTFICSVSVSVSVLVFELRIGHLDSRGLLTE